MDDNCTVYRTVDFVSKRWTLLILLELHKMDAIRYQALKNSLPGITPKILSLRLKELEKEGLIKKRVDSSTVPIISEYSLTKSGRDFFRVIKELKAWALLWKINNKVCENLDCKNCRI